jgi:integrase/recombinase XerC
MSRCNVREIVQSFREDLKIALDMADNTIKVYCYAADKFLDSLNEKDFAAPSYDDFKAWKASLSGMAQSSKALQLSGVRAFYKFLMRTGRIKDNPFPGDFIVRVKHQEPKTIPTVSQFLTLRRAATSLGSSERLALELLAGSGLRVNALLSLKPKHLRLGTARPSILVDAEDMSCKGNVADEIPISPYAAEMLKHEIADRSIGPDDNIFYVSDVTVRSWLAKVDRASGLNLGLVPHGLRHFFCCMTYWRDFDGGHNNAVWVQKAAGHASLETTTIYLDRALRIGVTEELWNEWAKGVA